MNKKNVLFIVEGFTDEPNLIKKMYEKCFDNHPYSIYSYKTNLHVLANKLDKDYPDFETDEIDIQLVLRSYETDKNAIHILSKKFTDVFLIFDFEPQDPYFNESIVKRMLYYFNDSTDTGKLFINYPMMQSYKDLDFTPDYSFLEKKVKNEDYVNYKYLVGTRSKFTDLNTYTNTTFINLTIHHLIKINLILNKEKKLINQIDYDQLDLIKLFDLQCFYSNSGFVYIVNTCLFLIIDYSPSLFFNRIKTHSSVFDIPI